MTTNHLRNSCDLRLINVMETRGFTDNFHPLIKTWRTWQFAQSLSSRTVTERTQAVSRMAAWNRVQPRLDPFRIAPLATGPMFDGLIDTDDAA